MRTRHRDTSELRATLDLALPIVVVQVGLMAMGVVDTLMVGHVSAAAVAAVALGNVYFFAIAVFGMGVLAALDPLVAQAVGAGDPASVSRGVQRGLVLAVLLSVPISLLLLPAGPVLAALGQPAAVVPIAAGYAQACIPGVLPFLAFLALRQSLQALSRIRPIVLTIVAANAVNAFLDWVLIYGELGAPPLGPVGSAWATTICRWLLALGLLAVAWPTLRPHLAPFSADAFQRRALWRMAKIGIPIGLQYQLEVGAFAVVALSMGHLGTVPVAAHQVALNLASLTFMVPMGISAAAAVRVGEGVGRGDPPGTRRAAIVSLLLGGGFMALCAVLLLSVPGFLASVYTRDPGVVALASLLIPVAGVFQVFDGLQVVSVGVLRGLGDTRMPMLINAIGFWVLGLPLGMQLGFRTGLGPVGLWWGLVIGLGVVAVLLCVRVRTKLGHDHRRVVVDDAAEASG